MTFETIKQNVKNGVYQPAHQHLPEKLPDHHTIDSSKSVKWNLEQIKRHNENRRSISLQNRQNQIAAENLFLSDLATAVHNEYDVNLKQADRIARRAYDETHHSYDESIDIANDLADFYIDLRELED